MRALKQSAGSADARAMVEDALDEVAANVWLLIAEEMEVQHRLGGHPVPVPECALCRGRSGPHRG